MKGGTKNNVDEIDDDHDYGKESHVTMNRIYALPLIFLASNYLSGAFSFFTSFGQILNYRPFSVRDSEVLGWSNRAYCFFTHVLFDF